MKRIFAEPVMNIIKFHEEIVITASIPGREVTLDDVRSGYTVQQADWGKLDDVLSFE